MGPDVGLRDLDVLLGAGDLTFVTFGESLVHISRLHRRKLDPHEADVDLDDICRGGDPHIDSAERQETWFREHESGDQGLPVTTHLSTASKAPQGQNCTSSQQPGSGLRNSSCEVDLVVDQIEVR